MIRRGSSAVQCDGGDEQFDKKKSWRMPQLEGEGVKQMRNESDVRKYRVKPLSLEPCVQHVTAC